MTRQLRPQLAGEVISIASTEANAAIASDLVELVRCITESPQPATNHPRIGVVPRPGAEWDLVAVVADAPFVAPQRDDAAMPRDVQQVVGDGVRVAWVEQLVDAIQPFAVTAQPAIVVEPVGLDCVDHQVEWTVMQLVKLPALMQQIGQIRLPPRDLQPGALA